MKRLRSLFVALVIGGCLPPAGAQTEVPYLSGRVVDHAEILSSDARRRVSETLRRHEARTGNQIAVLTMPGLEGESIEDFAVRVIEDWKLGRRDVDDGVLLVVAPRERRLRIEVGYGLEGTLTDAAASRIIRNVITPRFKSGDFDGGIEQGVKAIIATLDGAGAPVAQAANERPTASFIEAPDMALHERILLGAFIFGIIGLFTFIGIVAPGAGWFLYFFLIPFWAMFPVVIFGSEITLYILITYLVGFPVAKLLVSRSATYRKAAEDVKRKGFANIGGFTVSTAGAGSGGSWRSGGSSRSGGFSGGGGRSGGGGASGSW